ncbi:MAG: SRPBCC family protein [Planctomycetota bacterium JB042]
MAGFNITRRVDAPRDVTFETFIDFAKAPERIASIVSVEMLTDGPVGIGTRWRETRRAGAGTETAELEIVRFEENEGYVVECESQGCKFTSACLVWEDGGGSKVQVALDIEPHTWGARMRLWFVLPMIRREFQRDLDALAEAAAAEHVKRP